MDSVRVLWGGNRRFTGWDEAGHPIVMDATVEHRGDGGGMRPLQVFLCGLAGCTGMDVVSILEKKRQDVRGLEIRVEADQREDEFPKIYTHVRLHFVVRGYGVSPEAVERAIELSEEKYCSVGGMVAEEVRLQTSFEISEERTPGSVDGPAR